MSLFYLGHLLIVGIGHWWTVSSFLLWDYLGRNYSLPAVRGEGTEGRNEGRTKGRCGGERQARGRSK